MAPDSPKRGGRPAPSRGQRLRLALGAGAALLLLLRLWSGADTKPPVCLRETSPTDWESFVPLKLAPLYAAMGVGMFSACRRLRLAFRGVVPAWGGWGVPLAWAAAGLGALVLAQGAASALRAGGPARWAVCDSSSLPGLDVSVSKPRVAIVTHYDGAYAEDKQLESLVRGLHSAYAKRHGYDVVYGFEWFREHDWHAWRVDGMEPRLGLPRPSHWAKLPLLSSVLREYDWVVWFDFDALPMALDVPLERFMDARAHLVVSDDPGGSFLMNSGVMLLRKSERTQNLLREVWADPRKHCKLPGEQCSIEEHALRNPTTPIDVRILPGCMINSFQNSWSLLRRYNTGDFVAHFANNHNRIGRMKAFAETALSGGEVGLPFWSYWDC